MEFSNITCMLKTKLNDELRNKLMHSLVLLNPMHNIWSHPNGAKLSHIITHKGEGGRREVIKKPASKESHSIYRKYLFGREGNSSSTILTITEVPTSS